jgi:hypothetical protein
MFEHLFSHPSVVARHRAAPYAEEREHYLTHCAQQGYAHATLRLKARELLWVARKLHVHPELPVTPAQLEAAASEWDGRQQDAGRPLNIRRTQARFMAEARAWLRFLGCCVSHKTPSRSPH